MPKTKQTAVPEDATIFDVQDPGLGWHVTVAISPEVGFLVTQIKTMVEDAGDFAGLSVEKQKELIDYYVNRELLNTPKEIKEHIEVLFAERLNDLMAAIADSAGLKQFRIEKGRGRFTTIKKGGKLHKKILRDPGAPQLWTDAELRRALASAVQRAPRMDWASLARAIRLEYPDRGPHAANALRMLVRRRLGLSMADLKEIQKRTQSQVAFLREIIELKSGHTHTTRQIIRTA
jgi:hypothetical protein